MIIWYARNLFLFAFPAFLPENSNYFKYVQQEPDISIFLTNFFNEMANICMGQI